MAFGAADEVEDDGVGLDRPWDGRENRLVVGPVGNKVEPGRVDVETVEELETLDFLPGAGFEVTKGFVGATDSLFCGATGFAGGGLAAPKDEGRGFGAAGRPARLGLDAGLEGAVLGGAALGGAAFGGAGCEMIWEMPAGRRKRPCSGGQLKYRSPCTEPSFLPDGSGSSMPMNWPVAT